MYGSYRVDLGCVRNGMECMGLVEREVRGLGCVKEGSAVGCDEICGLVRRDV